MSDLTTWKFPGPTPSVEPSPRRVTVRAGATVVAASDHPLLLSWYGPGMLPTYCFSSAEVHVELLQPSGGAGVQPFVVDHDVRTADGVVARAARHLVDPPEPLTALDDHWTFSWDAGVSWFEEAEEVHVHARDPHHRVDVVQSDRHIHVEIDGTVVADTHRPLALFETSLPTRWYIPADDVRHELLEATETSSTCPFKGTASYWSVCIGESVHKDVVWSYLEPIEECPRIAGHFAFFNERVDFIVDGARVERPQTPWS